MRRYVCSVWWVGLDGSHDVLQWLHVQGLQ